MKGRTVLNIGSTFNSLGFLCSASRRKKAARDWEVESFQTSILNMAVAACGLAVSSSFQCGGTPRAAATSSLSLIQRFWGSTAKSSLTSQGTDGHCWISQPPTNQSISCIPLVSISLYLTNYIHVVVLFLQRTVTYARSAFKKLIASKENTLSKAKMLKLCDIQMLILYT